MSKQKGKIIKVLKALAEFVVVECFVFAEEEVFWRTCNFFEPCATSSSWVEIDFYKKFNISLIDINSDN